MRTIPVVLTTCALLAAALTIAPAANAAKRHHAEYTASDTHPFDATLLLAGATAKCARPAASRKRVSTRTALRHAAGLVTADHNRGAARKLNRNRRLRRQRGAVAAAVGAIGAESPDAAIAALLRAHKLKPRDPVALEGLAVLLTQRGKAADALALLTAANKLKQPRTTPYGIKRRAAHLNNVGFALVAQHNWNAAIKSLKKATKLSNTLTEAWANLGLAYACKKKQIQAISALTRAQTRRKWPDGEVIENGTTTIPNPLKTLDLTHGTTATLPHFTIPVDVAHARADFADLDAMQQAQRAKSNQLQAHYGSLTPAIVKLSPFARQRLYDVMKDINSSDRFPSIVPLAAALKVANDRYTQASLAASDQSGVHCDKLNDVFNAIGPEWNAAQAFAAERFRINSALAANLKDPAAHAMAMDLAEIALRSTVWVEVFGHIVDDARLAYYSCWETPAVAGDASTRGDTIAPPAPPCPSDLRGVKYKIKLEFVSLSFECEQIGVTVSTPGPIGVFGQLTVNAATGSVTVFGGAQAGQSIKVLDGPEIGGSMKDGVYVKVGSDGFEDAGLRVSFEGQAGWGGGTRAAGTKMDFTFVGAF